MKHAKLLWVDLEMTGLDPERDKILEIAAIATDWDLNPLASFEAVVKVDDDLIKSRMVGKFWEENQASYNSLVTQNSSGKPIKDIERSFLAFLDDHYSKKLPIYLAGNSIHQDRKFIDRELPEVSKRLHYRMLDVSAWKIYFENALNKSFKKPDAHRALSDINGSIEELKYYLGFINHDN